MFPLQEEAFCGFGTVSESRRIQSPARTLSGKLNTDVYHQLNYQHGSFPGSHVDLTFFHFVYVVCFCLSPIISSCDAREETEGASAQGPGHTETRHRRWPRARAFCPLYSPQRCPLTHRESEEAAGKASRVGGEEKRPPAGLRQSEKLAADRASVNGRGVGCQQRAWLDASPTQACGGERTGGEGVQGVQAGGQAETAAGC